MPELPEVETIRRQIQREVVGARIARVDVRFAGRLNVPAKTFAKTLEGLTLESADRRAKLLVLHFSSGWSVVIHLKMTGSLLLVPNDAEVPPHVHVIFELADKRKLFFEDVRKFGYLKLLRTDELERKVFSKEGYGPEPLGKEFTRQAFADCLEGPGPRTLKQKLTAQTCIAGIGNIYADEACWRAKVKPTRKISALKKDEIDRLYDGVISSLKESIDRHGTSADNYVDLHGEKGDNVRFLNVYGREGQKCARCGATIAKIRLGGRGTHYCPKCQK